MLILMVLYSEYLASYMISILINSHIYYSTSVAEGESDVVITRLITEDADSDKINTDSTVYLVSATGTTSNMDGKLL